MFVFYCIYVQVRGMSQAMQRFMFMLDPWDGSNTADNGANTTGIMAV